jgi:hypothetical protein
MEADCDVGRRVGLLLLAVPATETIEDALEYLFKESKRIETFETVALWLMGYRGADRNQGCR